LAPGILPVNLTVSSAPSTLSITFPQHPTEVELVPNMSPYYTFFTLVAADDAAPGNYNVNVTATYGSTSSTISFRVSVVSYLITIDNDAFSPDNITVPAGSTVYWINTELEVGGNDIHDVTSNPRLVGQWGPEGLSGPLKSPVLEPNPLFDSWSFTFTTAGTYNYYDDFTIDLGGTIIVTG
jgi:plastocyanin